MTDEQKRPRKLSARVVKDIACAAGGGSGLLAVWMLFIPYMASLSSAQHATVGSTIVWIGMLCLRLAACTFIGVLGIAVWGLVGGMVLLWIRKDDDQVREVTEELGTLPLGKYVTSILRRSAPGT
jgi:hypothetical protein